VHLGAAVLGPIVPAVGLALRTPLTLSDPARFQAHARAGFR
jgi:hypothetical protein